MSCQATSPSPPTVFSINQPEAVSLAAELLRQSKVIALPTDTVYGLACSANDPAAIQRLYEIKGREEKKPVAICVADFRDLKRYGRASHIPDEMLKDLLPGPVTLVLVKSRRLTNPYLNPGVKKIGIRIPDFNFIREVSRRFGLPIALTSANKSSEPSTLNVDEFKPLWSQLGAVFDGGQLGVTEEQRSASTVVDISHPGAYQVIREGVAVKKTVAVLDRFGFSERKIKNSV